MAQGTTKQCLKTKQLIWHKAGSVGSWREQVALGGMFTAQLLITNEVKIRFVKDNVILAEHLTK